MKRLLEYILKILSQLILWRYKPTVIGITGSVGKTSAKEAVAVVLKEYFNVRASKGNYNNEIGVPLTVLGEDSAGRSIFGWLAIFIKGIKKLFFFKKDYPEVLILEMGADRPGDIAYLAHFIKLQMGLVTAIGEMPVHIEFFPERDDLIEEKANLIRCLPRAGTAILNYDDLSVRMMREQIPEGVELITYGFGQGSLVRAVDYQLQFHNFEDYGIVFKIEYKGNLIPFRLHKVLGRQQVYAALAAISVAIKFGMNLIDISEALSQYQSPPGRLKLLKGIKNTWLLDDTYNASPAATLAALETLEEIYNSIQQSKIEADMRKIIVLGDMLELGLYTEKAHRQVGKKASEIADLIFVVGSRAKFIAEEAIKCGFNQKSIFFFDSSDEAKLPVQKTLRKGDLVLIKGSQGMRMEKIVKEIMSHSEQAKDLLVRQGSGWLRDLSKIK